MAANKTQAEYIKELDLRAIKAGLDPDECRRKAYLDKLYGEGTYEKVRLWNEEQDCRCKICGDREKTHYHGVRKHLMVDHDHLTGKVRGLICHRCNLALGQISDSKEILEKIQVYLSQTDVNDRLIEAGIVETYTPVRRVRMYKRGDYTSSCRSLTN